MRSYSRQMRSSSLSMSWRHPGPWRKRSRPTRDSQRPQNAQANTPLSSEARRPDAEPGTHAKNCSPRRDQRPPHGPPGTFQRRQDAPAFDATDRKFVDHNVKNFLEARINRNHAATRIVFPLPEPGCIEGKLQTVFAGLQFFFKDTDVPHESRH